MKKCSYCKKWKELNQFGKCRQAKDGLQYSCKECRRLIVNKYNHTDKRKKVQQKYDRGDKAKQKQKEYRQSEKRKATQKRYYNRRGLDIIHQYRQNNPNAYKAKMAVNQAVFDGILPRISTLKCNHCNDKARDYHHWSYEPEYWLDVTPLCRQCHINIHKAMAQ